MFALSLYDFPALPYDLAFSYERNLAIEDSMAENIIFFNAQNYHYLILQNNAFFMAGILNI